MDLLLYSFVVKLTRHAKFCCGWESSEISMYFISFDLANLLANILSLIFAMFDVSYLFATFYFIVKLTQHAKFCCGWESSEKFLA
jgi:hypothetical protein